MEISYNSIVFGLLVMETQPGGEGINVIDTDLEVDFAPPVGYVEPERPKAAPQATMASKLNIDLSSSTPGSSRPGSSMAGGFAGGAPRGGGISKDGEGSGQVAGKKHRFEDTEYIEQSREIVDNVKNAVAAGMPRPCSSAMYPLI